ncbi:MAG: hypothetical protein OEZ59_11310 [Deltaproteobacteria bacterium]|nr:hypothetical protein [Deltaproteobacteria bacterium]
MKTLIPGLAWRVVLAMLVLPVMASGQAGSVDTDPAEETGTLSVLAAGFKMTADRPV